MTYEEREKVALWILEDEFTKQMQYGMAARVREYAKTKNDSLVRSITYAVERALLRHEWEPWVKVERGGE